MTCNVPIVATDTGFIPEAVKHDVTGFLVREKDPAAIDGAIQAIWRDMELRQPLTDQARLLVE